MQWMQTLVDHSPWALFILIFGFISLGLTSLYFKSILSSIIEIVLLIALIVLSTNFIGVLVVSILQVGFSLFLLYRLMGAIHYNYMLVMEKTNQAPRNFTQDDNGTRSNFL